MPTAPPSSKEANAFFVAAVLSSFAIWPVAFNLGAYGTVFTDHLFKVWAASIAALLANALIGRTEEGEQYFMPLGAVLLIVPSAWIIGGIIFLGNSNELVQLLMSVLALAAILLSLPYIMFIIMRAALPEAMELTNKRLRYGLAGIACVVACSAFLAGKYNYLIISCEDFDISGANPPDNCWSVNAPLPGNWWQLT